MGVDLDLALYRAKVGAAHVVELMSNSRSGSICGARTSSPQYCLTFDDGPSPDGTLAALDALSEHGGHATFFVLLSNVRRYPRIVERIVAEGHEVGLHGFTHERIDRVPRHRLSAELTVASDEISNVTGSGVRWYRPPYGVQTISSSRIVREAGLTSVLWNRTSWDWKRIDPTTRMRAACYRPRAGNIILAHDGCATIEDEATTAYRPDVDRTALISHILTEYDRVGLTSVTCSELMRDAHPVYRIHYRLAPCGFGRNAGLRSTP